MWSPLQWTMVPQKQWAAVMIQYLLRREPVHCTISPDCFGTSRWTSQGRLIGLVSHSSSEPAVVSMS